MSYQRFDSGSGDYEVVEEGEAGLHEYGGDYDDRDLSPPMADGGNENFRVAVRVRPPVPRELEGSRPFTNVVRVPNDKKSITLCEHLETEEGRGGVYSTQGFTFDRVYDPNSKQRDVYENSAMPAVLSTLEGYNATLIAYGQTGTGKTFTMEGFTSDDQRGIIPRSTEEVFSYIQSCRHRKMKFLVRASYLQIYNENISDLLKPQGRNLTIRQTKQKGVYVDGLSEWVVRSPNEIYGLMERGCGMRATASHKMSELSSRSHAIFIIIVEIMEGDESQPHCFKIGKLNIVDLAGSEKVRQTGVTGQRLEETKKINWSLHELGNVISALTDTNRKDKFIPYRNSKLTNILKDSLGGNCKTTLIACISPALDAYTESLSTLKFANRAKNIQNDATINEDLDQGATLRKYEKEVKRLKGLLMERDAAAAGGGGGGLGGMVSGTRGDMVDMEAKRKQATHEKEAAVQGHARVARLLNEEQDAKREIEEKYLELQGKLQEGEARKDDWSHKMEELDRERQVIDEDKAQVDRYKQLLLKQRDIMLNLTTRLNERDEHILRLQEEIDAYDAHVQMLEDAMECAAPTVSTKLEAEEYLTTIRAAASSSGTTPLASSSKKYYAEGNRNSILEAEEKIIELLMLKGRSTAAAHADAWDRSDDRKELENLLRDRVEVCAKVHAEERLGALQQDLGILKAKLQQSEERRRNVEYSLELSSMSSNDGAGTTERLQRYLDREVGTLKDPYESRIRDLGGQLDVEREQRRKLQREFDRFKFEVGHVKELVGKEGSDEAQQLQRLYNSLTQIEDSVLSELLRTGTSISSSPILSPSSPSFVDPTTTGGASFGSKGRLGSSFAGGGSTDQASAAASAKAAALEAQLETQKQRYNSMRSELSLELDSRNAQIRQMEEQHRQAKQTATPPPPVVDPTATKEIAQLKRAVATHVKDRRALKSILDTRISGKLDNIATMLLHASTGAGGAGGQNTTNSGSIPQLQHEVSSLQSLVSASVKAMESD